MKSSTIDQLRQELASDEGCKYEIYLDHLNLPTFGIGHLIRKDDKEYGLPVGTVIEQERVDNVFKLDIAVTLEDCHRLYEDWNDLPEETRSTKSINQFKELITPVRQEVPEYLYTGERKFQILQTRLRLRCSDLNEDLHAINLADSPICSCGQEIEDAEHFLKDCHLYNQHRQNLPINLHN